MIHRHMEVAPGTAAEDLPAAAIVDILERGDLDDWRPIAAAVARHPNGGFAQKVARLADAYPVYGTSSLWRAWIGRCRARVEGGRRPRAIGLATLRGRKGLTQADLAGRLGMSQSDLSKLEHRRDVRVSTLRAYLQALGGTVRILFEAGGELFDVRLAGDDR